jgi:hypothetical protein
MVTNKDPIWYLNLKFKTILSDNFMLLLLRKRSWGSKRGSRMELQLHKQIGKNYWLLLSAIFLFISYSNIVSDWELHLYTFNELEDLGRLLFVLGISACESSLLTLFLLWMTKLLKDIIQTKKGPE